VRALARPDRFKSGGVRRDTAQDVYLPARVPRPRPPTDRFVSGDGVSDGLGDGNCYAPTPAGHATPGTANGGWPERRRKRG
jgi:hypothetical protein